MANWGESFWSGYESGQLSHLRQQKAKLNDLDLEDKMNARKGKALDAKLSGTTRDEYETENPWQKVAKKLGSALGFWKPKPAPPTPAAPPVGGGTQNAGVAPTGAQTGAAPTFGFGDSPDQGAPEPPPTPAGESDDDSVAVADGGQIRRAIPRLADGASPFDPSEYPMGVGYAMQAVPSAVGAVARSALGPYGPAPETPASPAATATTAAQQAPPATPPAGYTPKPSYQSPPAEAAPAAPPRTAVPTAATGGTKEETKKEEKQDLTDPLAVDFSRASPVDIPHVTTDDWVNHRAEMVQSAVLKGASFDEANEAVDKRIKDQQTRTIVSNIDQSMDLLMHKNLPGAAAAVKAAYANAPNGYSLDVRVLNGHIVAQAIDEKTGKPADTPHVIDMEALQAFRDNFAKPGALAAWVNDKQKYEQQERMFHRVTEPLAKARIGYEEAAGQRMREQGELARARADALEAGGPTLAERKFMAANEKEFRKNLQMEVAKPDHVDALLVHMSRTAGIHPNWSPAQVYQYTMSKYRAAGNTLPQGQQGQSALPADDSDIPNPYDEE